LTARKYCNYYNTASTGIVIIPEKSWLIKVLILQNILELQ